MIRPPCLREGDKIAIVAPARKVSPAEMENAIRIFGNWGLKVVTGRYLFGQHHQYSGTDAERCSDLQAMLDDTEIKAIISARGGYGTVRLIDNLDFSTFSTHPKWIIGYSDITALHAHIQANLGIETLHAIMPINFPDAGNESPSIESLRKALFGEPLQYDIPATTLNRKGSAGGPLTGGNLSMLYSIAGSVSDIDTHGKILLLEDVDEYLYHIDRMMMNLKRAGKLAGLKGMIVGGLTDMKDNTVPFGKSAAEIIHEYVRDLGIPVCFGFPSGHQPDNYALIMGREVFLDVSETGASIRFGEAEAPLLKGQLAKRLLKPGLFFLGFILFIYLILYLIRFFIR